MTLGGLTDAREVLWRNLIDYAGLYPPAALPVNAAIAGYRAARRSPARRSLARFVCGVSHLEDVARTLARSMHRDEEPWTLTVVIDTSPETAAGRLGTFLHEMTPAVVVDGIEARLGDDVDGAEARLERLIGLAAHAGAQRIHAEVPVGGDPEPFLQLLKGRPGLTAKVRCGGVTADAYPSVASLARFLMAAARDDIAWKATAGLHHAFRHDDRGLGVVHHGLVNLILGALEARRGAETATVVAALEAAPDAVHLGTAGLRWRDRRYPVDELAALRTRFLGIGSCSFDEPVEDLAARGMLSPRGMTSRVTTGSGTADGAAPGPGTPTGITAAHVDESKGGRR